MTNPVALIIMDGYGITEHKEANAVAIAKTPFLDSLFEKYPNTLLSASGLDVGLPDGQIGNSEVGHTNIGAGRIIYQDLTNISHEIETGDFFKNEAYIYAMDKARESGKALHLLGLTSPGGVHSHTDHLFALIRMAAERGVEKLYLHCFTDGRDVPPASGADSIAETVQVCKKYGVGKIATVCGRFYAMDRDKRWERVERAYNALRFGEGNHADDPVEAMNASYANGITDEFVEPVICDENGMIRDGDSIIFINFRPDRAREITRAFVDPDFDGFERRGGMISVNYVCTTCYDETIPNVKIAYPPKSPANTLGEIASRAGLKQLRIAETEKYAHVTFFFNGGREEPFDGEERILVASPKQFPTYDLIPEMSAVEVADKACDAIAKGGLDLIILNFANCDMVGHTGDLNAAIRAVETVDKCTERVVKAVQSLGGICVITADHGNAEKMLDDDGETKHTAHTTNPVPFIVTKEGIRLIPGKLCDISPTVLKLLGICQPAEMTGKCLICE